MTTRIRPHHTLFIAGASGAMTVLAFAPFGIYPAALIALMIWYVHLPHPTPRQALLYGWWFGIGFFGAGVYWVRISLSEFGNLPLLIADVLTLLFVATMALYYAAVGLLAHLLLRAPPQRNAAAVWIMPAVWVSSEWLRSELFTGFPWLLIGNSHIDSPIAGIAPLFGVYGLSMVVVLSAGLLWYAGSARQQIKRRLIAVGSVCALWSGCWLIGQVTWTQPSGPPVIASVVQASIPQATKWQPETLLPTIATYLELTRPLLGHSAVIVWPETAVPAFLHEVQMGLIDPLSRQARSSGSDIVLGIPIMVNSAEYYNGMLSIGQHTNQYYKRHLVPFGEYLPFHSLLQPLIDWFAVPMSHFSRGTAALPLLRVGTHTVGASICYEDAFPDDVRQALPTAAYLINISNDAWFGDSLAPAQHLAAARMRALENGRDLIRATNTGISALIDWRGHLITTVPLWVSGQATAAIQPRTGATPFAWWAHTPVLIAVAMIFIVALWQRYRLLLRADH